MPSFSKSVPVVLLVGASVIAGPISRGDQNNNNNNGPKCIDLEECRPDGHNFCELVTDLKKSLQDPNYCPDGMTRDQFLEDGSKCWNMMHPEDPFNGIPRGGFPGPFNGHGPAQRPQECTLSNGFDLVTLPLEQYLQPGSDYCPTGMTRPEFERYARTCWNAMHPDHPRDGDNCDGHLDLCPLLRCGPDGLPLRGPQPHSPMQHHDPSQGGPQCELNGVCDYLHGGPSSAPFDPSHGGWPSTGDQPPAWWWSNAPSSGPQGSKSPYSAAPFDHTGSDPNSGHGSGGPIRLPLLGGDGGDRMIDLSLVDSSSHSQNGPSFDPSRSPNPFSGDNNNAGDPFKKTTPPFGTSGDDAGHRENGQPPLGPFDGKPASGPSDDSKHGPGDDAGHRENGQPPLVSSGPFNGKPVSGPSDDSKHGPEQSGPSDPNHDGKESKLGGDDHGINVTLSDKHSQDGQQKVDEHDGNDNGKGNCETQRDVKVNKDGVHVDDGMDSKKGSESSCETK